MKVAFVHHHLEPGGVTRVMETAWSALASLEQDLQGVVLSGLPYKGSELPEVKVVENIGYATRSSRADPRVIVELLEKRLAPA